MPQSRSPHRFCLPGWLVACTFVVFVTLGFATSHAQTPAAGDKPSTNGSAATTLPNASPNSAIQSQLAELQAKLDQLSADSTVDATLKERLSATYKSTIEAIKSIATDTEAIAKFAKTAALAPDRLTETRDQIKVPLKPFTAPDDADRLTIEELRQRRTESDTALQAARKSLQSLETTLRDRESRRAQLPMVLSEARAALDALETTPLPDVEDDPQGTLAAARQAERNAKIQAMKKSIEAMNQEQSTIDAETELLPARIELLKREVQQLEAPFRFWTEKLGTQKQYQVENDVAQHIAALEADGIDPAQSMINRLQDDWIGILREQSQLERKLSRERASNEELSELYATTKKEIEDDLIAGRGLRSGLGLKLQLARGRLPSSAVMRDEVQSVDQLIDLGRALQTTLELTLKKFVMMDQTA